MNPPDEPAPVVRVYGRAVTESDVKESLRMLGDDFVRRYERGELPRADAYAIARRRVKAQMALAGRRRSAKEDR